MVAISPLLQKFSRQVKRTHDLGFEILSDEGNKTAEQFGLKWPLPDYLIEIYKGFDLDLERYNGDDSWTLPMPAGYVIGQDGVIVRAEYDPDYTHRPEPSETLDFLRDYVSNNQ